MQNGNMTFENLPVLNRKHLETAASELQLLYPSSLEEQKTGCPDLVQHAPSSLY